MAPHSELERVFSGHSGAHPLVRRELPSEGLGNSSIPRPNQEEEELGLLPLLEGPQETTPAQIQDKPFVRQNPVPHLATWQQP